MTKLKKEELLEWHKRNWRTRLSFGDRPLFEEEQAYQQIKEMIQKSKVTGEWIEEKARKLLDDLTDYDSSSQYWTEAMRYAKDFIHSLVGEIQCK